MKRRSLIGGALAAGTSSRVFAQSSGQSSAQSGGKLKRLAIVSAAEPIALMVENSENPYYRALFEELRRLGQIEGKTITVERYGRDSGAGSPVELMQQAVRGQPDVIYGIAFGAQYKQATAAIPVVALTANPVALGLAESLARPGGNITGVSVDIGPAIHGKRVELLREAFPALSSLAFVTLRPIWGTVQGPPMQAVADSLGLRLLPKLIDVPASEKSFRDAIGELRGDGANGVIFGDNPNALGFRAAIVEAVAETRLPALYTFPETVEAGGLMAYSFDLKELNRYAARSIDAILRGTPPGTIPFYQATTFTLSINLKTAAAQGIVFPQSILGRADRVID